MKMASIITKIHSANFFEEKMQKKMYGLFRDKHLRKHQFIKYLDMTKNTI